MKFITSMAAAAALYAFAGTSHAADLQERIAGTGPHDWSGVYVGLQAGGAWGRGYDGTDTVHLKGGSVGAYAGGNWQNGNWVFGLEADVTRAWSNGRIFTVDFSTDWQASVRGRVGYAFDRTLVYASGGVAIAQALFSAPPVFVARDTYVGWTVGAGVEYAFTANWSTRLDYRYSDYGSSSFGLGMGSVRLTEHAARIGVAYKF